MRKVKKARWLVVLMVVAMLFALVPATVSADHEGPGDYAFIPNSGEASVSKVFLGDDIIDPYEVARYYTAEREDPDPADWRTSRNAMDADGNGWVINTGADGEDLQGSIVRIQMDTEGLTTNVDPDNPLDFGTDEAVQVFDVGDPGDMPRAIAIDDDGYIWVGFYSGGQLVQYEYDEANEELDAVGEPYAPDEEYHIGYYEMEFAPDGTLFISSRDSTPELDDVDTGVWSFDGTDFVRETEFNPYSILIDHDNGEVYASTYDGHSIWVRGDDAEYDVSGDEDQYLRGMAFDEDDLIWIASTDGHGGGDHVYWFDPSDNSSGYFNIDTEYGTTPVGVGMDGRGVMWVVCRTDDAGAGFVQGFTPDPDDPEFQGAVEVGERPYAYGVFTVPEIPTYEICGFKYLALDGESTETKLDGWTITLEKWDDDEGEWVDHHETVTGTVYDNDDPIDGKYCFADLTEGRYRVTEEVKDGWNQVYPYDEGAEEGYEYAYVVELPGGKTYPNNGEAVYYNFINEPPELEVVCETAWAYNEDTSFPNNEVPDNPSEAWGWTNQVEDGHYDFDLYTGAGQNDTEKGELVGTVNVHIEGENSWVEYELFDEDCWFSEVHLWVGDTELPMVSRGRQGEVPTAAPGQFNYSADLEENKKVHRFDFDVSDFDEIWIAAHAVVCCNEVVEE